MRTTRWIRLTVFLLTAVMLLMSVTGGTSVNAQAGATATIAKGKTIKIGWAGDESKQLINPSKGILYGAQIAVNRANAAGGIQGFNLELVPQDDQCLGDVATTVAQKFASDPDIVGVVGHVCSGSTIPASDVYEKARIVMVSASSTAAAVTNRGLTVVNRIPFLDDNQAKADALFVFNELKLKKMAILDDGQSYGKGLADTLKANFAQLGGTVTDAESIDPDAKDYRPVLTKMLSDVPDVLFFGGYYGPAALLTQQMKEIGLTNTVFLSDDGTYGQPYLDLTGKDSEGVYASFSPTPTDDAFKAELEKTFNVKYDDYAPYQEHGYDAAGIIIAAIKAVAKVDASGNLVVDREALIKAVRGTTDYKGLIGNLSCNSKGDCNAAAVGVFQAQSGKWVLKQSYTPPDLEKAFGAPATPAATAAK